MQLEKSLKCQIEQWEVENGSEFRVHGQLFMQYVEEQWSLHQLEKEKEKLERVITVNKIFTATLNSSVQLHLLYYTCLQQMKKSKQIEEDMLYGTSLKTPTKRRLGAAPTPGKSRKVVQEHVYVYVRICCVCLLTLHVFFFITPTSVLAQLYLQHHQLYTQLHLTLHLSFSVYETTSLCQQGET